MWRSLEAVGRLDGIRSLHFRWMSTNWFFTWVYTKQNLDLVKKQSVVLVINLSLSYFKSHHITFRIMGNFKLSWQTYVLKSKKRLQGPKRHNLILNIKLPICHPALEEIRYRLSARQKCRSFSTRNRRRLQTSCLRMCRFLSKKIANRRNCSAPIARDRQQWPEKNIKI